MNSNKKYKLFSFFIFLIFITSMGCWIGWGKETIIQSILGLGAVLCAKKTGIKLELSRKNFIACILYYIAYLFVRLDFSILVLFTQIPSTLIPIIYIICIPSKLKYVVLENITKWFAVLMLLGIPFYILSNFGLESPIISSPDSDSDGYYGNYYNYIFYVKQISGMASGFQRFSGPFTEPGHLGMMCAFILFANKFNFNSKSLKFIATTLFLTLSLAGYLLFLIGYIFILYYKNRLQLYQVLISTLFLICIIFVGNTYNGGDNIINEKILSRLEYDKEKGLAGNNRNNLYVIYYYEQMLKDPNLLLMGYNDKQFKMMSEYLVGSGFQLFLIKHGLIHLILAFVFYFFIGFNSLDKKYALLFLIFVILCFLQRTYIFWFSWIICFEYGICISNRTLILAHNKNDNIYNSYTT